MLKLSPLQPLFGETFPMRSANTEDEARLDVKMQNCGDHSNGCPYFDFDFRVSTLLHLQTTSHHPNLVTGNTNRRRGVRWNKEPSPAVQLLLLFSNG